ncbi:hypothetical protein BDB00DRAFT_848604 [Zychaea mexicana]|uniref:uncharacterized protein n=1 Tax=Zychaea mexicana TaxID=64656 RepID=UPI0022FEFAD8|nr:uncharacterized protein BDB00DRAFT_848604 [Zychaea mexicana]KAI9488360.1 hypothetical protein BDB00DRAFT_848604 [Zychaea mexicana]
MRERIFCVWLILRLYHALYYMLSIKAHTLLARTFRGLRERENNRVAFARLRERKIVFYSARHVCTHPMVREKNRSSLQQPGCATSPPPKLVCVPYSFGLKTTRN